jgi:hypothetical protein
MVVKKINKDKLMIPENSNRESLSFYFGRSKHVHRKYLFFRCLSNMISKEN